MGCVLKPSAYCLAFLYSLKSQAVPLAEGGKFERIILETEPK